MMTTAFHRAAGRWLDGSLSPLKGVGSVTDPQWGEPLSPYAVSGTTGVAAGISWTPWSVQALALLADSSKRMNPRGHAEAIHHCVRVWHGWPAELRTAHLQAEVCPGVTVAGLWALVGLSAHHFSRPSMDAADDRLARWTDSPSFVLPMQADALHDVQSFLMSLGVPADVQPRQFVWETLVHLGHGTRGMRVQRALDLNLSSAYMELERRRWAHAPSWSNTTDEWAMWADVPHRMANALSIVQVDQLLEDMAKFPQGPQEARMRWLTGLLLRQPAPNDKALKLVERVLNATRFDNTATFIHQLLQEGAAWPPDFRLPSWIQDHLARHKPELSANMEAHRLAALLSGAVVVQTTEERRPRL